MNGAPSPEPLDRCWRSRNLALAAPMSHAPRRRGRSLPLRFPARRASAHPPDIADGAAGAPTRSRHSCCCCRSGRRRHCSRLSRAQPSPVSARAPWSAPQSGAALSQAPRCARPSSRPSDGVAFARAAAPAQPRDRLTFRAAFPPAPAAPLRALFRVVLRSARALLPALFLPPRPARPAAARLLSAQLRAVALLAAARAPRPARRSRRAFARYLPAQSRRRRSRSTSPPRQCSRAALVGATTPIAIRHAPPGTERRTRAGASARARSSRTADGCQPVARSREPDAQKEPARTE